MRRENMEDQKEYFREVERVWKDTRVMEKWVRWIVKWVEEKKLEEELEEELEDKLGPEDGKEVENKSEEYVQWIVVRMKIPCFVSWSTITRIVS